MVGMGFPIVLSPFIVLWLLGMIGFVHLFVPLLYVLYCPLTLKYWQQGRRSFMLFVVTALWAAALNGFGLGLLVQGGQFVRGTDPFELIEVFRIVPIYIICGVITGALHWLFLSYAQRRLERGKIYDTP